MDFRLKAECKTIEPSGCDKKWPLVCASVQSLNHPALLHFSVFHIQVSDVKKSVRVHRPVYVMCWAFVIPKNIGWSWDNAGSHLRSGESCGIRCLFLTSSQPSVCSCRGSCGLRKLLLVLRFSYFLWKVSTRVANSVQSIIILAVTKKLYVLLLMLCKHCVFCFLTQEKDESPGSPKELIQKYIRSYD